MKITEEDMAVLSNRPFFSGLSGDALMLLTASLKTASDRAGARLIGAVELYECGLIRLVKVKDGISIEPCDPDDAPQLKRPAVLRQ